MTFPTPADQAPIPPDLGATLDCIPSGLAIYRLDGAAIRPVFRNRAFFRVLGYSQDHIGQLSGEMVFLGVHPQDLPTLLERIQTLLTADGVLQHTCRIFHDARNEYRWIRIEGSSQADADGGRLLYAVYSDVSEQKLLETELTGTNDRMQSIVNAIPGGVAVYRLADTIETLYFSDGVPELTGYTPEEYRQLARRDALELTYTGDRLLVAAQANRAVRDGQPVDFEFRKLHRDGRIIWVRAQAKPMGTEGGCPVLLCVFHNITALKESQLEVGHLVNAIPGGIASYQVVDGSFRPVFFSDGVPAITGHTREELEALARDDALALVYEGDRPRVSAAVAQALQTGQVLDIAYRSYHKNGDLVWLHLNGCRMGPLTAAPRFYASFTSLSEESRLFQTVAGGAADGVYVIDRESYDLFYCTESEHMLHHGEKLVGRKCYEALHGQTAPCPFCTLKDGQMDREYEIAPPDTGRVYSSRFREIDWSGIPAYVHYVRDITQEVETRRSKARLEQYFQTLIQNLPGGVAVMNCSPEGRLTPEYISDGLAAMLGMPLEALTEAYHRDAMDFVHPEDREKVAQSIAVFLRDGAGRRELVYRLRKYDGSYIWARVFFTSIPGDGSEMCIYAVYYDITLERAEQERVLQEYNDLLLDHYRTVKDNALFLGHCNVTRDRILELEDCTGCGLLARFGERRESFFTGLADLVVDEADRQAFLDSFLNGPFLAAYARGETELSRQCFIRLPGDAAGRWAQFQITLVKAPDSGDLTGILTVSDITEQRISRQIMEQLSSTGYDMVTDLDLLRDRYTIVTARDTLVIPPKTGVHSQWVDHMARERVVPKDRERYQQSLDAAYMLQQLAGSGAYTFDFSVLTGDGVLCTKSMTVSPVDLRLGRVCLSRRDITDSIREQQGLLHMLAYTFDLLGYIDVQTEQLTMYSRRAILEELPPHVVPHYNEATARMARHYAQDGDLEEMCQQFRLETMLRHLEAAPEGYDLVFPYRTYPYSDGAPLHYKKISFLWGDPNHRTVCLVRADVTDMLARERAAKEQLEQALALAEKASRAKGDFLSAMSHDIRTPMNAIIGMTTLAQAHGEDPARVADCLQKIMVSSRHLLDLINDILDMSKIEQAGVTLKSAPLDVRHVTEQLAVMFQPQAQMAGLELSFTAGALSGGGFLGDSLRLNQILINILSNAVKFTPAGGRVTFHTEELPARAGADHVRYRFSVRDTGIGMSPETLEQIFEPFTRGRHAEGFEGTGLGLSIAKGLVELMGGTLAVESRLHEGSLFQVELEFPRSSLPAPARARSTPPAFLAGLRFLIAEDNAINAEILVGILELFGAAADIRADGAQTVEAFAQAAPGTYAAVLMDIQMPVMNGYEAARAIRALPRDDADIPIIAMTANAFIEDVQAALDAGMNAHVAKPLDLAVLEAILRKVLSLHREA